MKRAFFVTMGALILMLFSGIYVFDVASAQPATSENQETKSAKELLKEYLFDRTLTSAQKDAQYLLSLIDNSDFGPFTGIGVLLSQPGDNEVPQAVILDVFMDRPAAKAGLRRGDVILSVNGRPVSSAKEMVKEVRGDNSVGRTVTLEVGRRGTKVTVTMTTALVRGDRRPEAARLRETIARQSEIILEDMKNSFARAVELGIELKAEDTRAKILVLDLLDAYDKWYTEKMDAINNLYNPGLTILYNSK